MAQLDSALGPDAEAVVERLQTVARRRPFDRMSAESTVVDRLPAESALADHLRALGLDPRSVRWITADNPRPDAWAQLGFVAAWASLWRTNKGRPVLGQAAFTEVDRALYGGGITRRGGLVGPALKEEKGAGRQVKRVAHEAQELASRVLQPNNRSSRYVDLEIAVHHALQEKGVVEPIRQGEREGALNAEIAKAEALGKAEETPGWLARTHAVRKAGKPAEALERVANAFLPLVDAVEAGLWLFWVTDDEIIAVATPS